MCIIRYILLLIAIFISCNTIAQCDYSINNLSHVDCYNDNTGEITISLSINNATVSWLYPDGFTTNNSQNITNLYAGDYVLTLFANSIIVCVDTITVLETIPISASFNLSKMCSELDSADVITTIWGGTPPYTTLWSTGDTARNTIDLPPNPALPYSLTITDANFCTGIEYLDLPLVVAMNPFMSSVGTICKDDNSGSARVFVTEGTPPFIFRWLHDSIVTFEHDSFSVTEFLLPGEYIVEITDGMGCEIQDTIEVQHNPSICLKVYKAFSPNDDAIHEFWEIENIHLYPEALIVIYDRNGREVYRRRNYQNAEGVAFGGKDQEDRVLPSGGYYYVIDLGNGDPVFKGTLTIVR